MKLLSTFIVGGIALMLSIQLISLGILALQSKNYFEEIFHLGTIYTRMKRKGAKIVNNSETILAVQTQIDLPSDQNATGRSFGEEEIACCLT